MSTGKGVWGVWASLWAVLRDGNHEEWGAVGGMRALGNLSEHPKIRPHFGLELLGARLQIALILGYFGSFSGVVLEHIMELAAEKSFFSSGKARQSLQMMITSLCWLF